MIIEKKTCKCGQSYKTWSGFKFLPKLCLDCAFGINMSEKVTVNLAPFFEKRGVTKRGVTKRGVTSRRGNVIHVNFSGAKASPVVGDAKMRVLYDK